MQRLDVGTSGVMVICKSEHAYSVLKNAFRHRTVDKTYHALVQGHPDPHEGTIDAPIGRHPKADYKFAVMADGRHSVTHYETLEAHRFASLLEVHLETGRTHQIRVHMAALKHPCVGDLTYGADPTLAKRVGPGAAVAARRAARLRAPRHGELRRVRVAVPRRPRPGPRGHPGCRLRSQPTRGPAPAEPPTRRRDRRRGRPARLAALRAGPRGGVPGDAAPVHSADEVPSWVGGWDLSPARGLGGRESTGRLVGYARSTADLARRPLRRPGAAGQGIGSALLDLVKARRAGRVLPVGLRARTSRRAPSTPPAASSSSSAPTAAGNEERAAGPPDGLARP